MTDKRRNKGKTNWYGEQLTHQQIADRYDVHRVTVSVYFRQAKERGVVDVNADVLARLLAKPTRGNKKSNKFPRVKLENPRIPIEAVKGPTSYERRLWGY